MAAKTIDDVVDNFTEPDVLDFDGLIILAKALGVEVNYPPVDDIYPEWENELRVEVSEELLKAITN